MQHEMKCAHSIPGESRINASARHIIEHCHLFSLFYGTRAMAQNDRLTVVFTLATFNKIDEFDASRTRLQHEQRRGDPKSQA